MPKSLNDVVQEALGAQALAVCQLQAENEALRADIADLKAEQAKAKSAPPAA